MIPNSFEYKKASSVADALTWLKDDPSAKILAGGHSLIPAMKLRLSQPSLLIDISKIADLNFIRDRGKYIAVGAATTHGTIGSHKTTTQKLTWVANAANLIGDVQVRNVGTIGGAIAHADPAADWPAVLLAAEATIKTESAFGERKIPAQEFFKGFFMTELQEGEIITEIHFPDPTSSDASESFRAAYEKFPQPASRFAIVGCAVALRLGANGLIETARVAFNGVSDSAYRAEAVERILTGKTLGEDAAAEASQEATKDAAMILSDHYGDEAYRAHLAQVICKRAILACQYD